MGKVLTGDDALCCCGVECPVCQDGTTPAEITVTVPDDWTPVGDCIDADCDDAIGDFVLSFTTSSINSCTWEYSFTPEDDCQWIEITLNIINQSGTVTMAIFITSQTHVIDFSVVLPDVDDKVDCTTFGGLPLAVGFDGERGIPANCNWGGSDLTVTLP
ncbi:MAG: hypothetical protein GY832_24230 [Chloroflexi bacterium]|nr:hypothetical protein [Chloroflexota bacterium]